MLQKPDFSNPSLAFSLTHTSQMVKTNLNSTYFKCIRKLIKDLKW